MIEILTYKARTAKKLNNIKLSKMTKIGKSTLYKIENGEVSPRLCQLEAIAKALEVKITDLFESENK